MEPRAQGEILKDLDLLTLFLLNGFAPASSNKVTMAIWPAWQAMWRGVISSYQTSEAGLGSSIEHTHLILSLNLDTFTEQESNHFYITFATSNVQRGSSPLKVSESHTTLTYCTFSRASLFAPASNSRVATVVQPLTNTVEGRMVFLKNI
jgi:hypothetical protein